MSWTNVYLDMRALHSLNASEFETRAQKIVDKIIGMMDINHDLAPEVKCAIDI